MTPLNLTQKESIARRLEFMQTEIGDLSEYRRFDYETYSNNRTARRNVERILENIANAAIDTAKTLLVGEEAALPETYRDAILKLAAIGVLSPEMAAKMAEISRARNVLAHQYLDIRWQLVADFLATGEESVAKFIEQVSKRLNSGLSSE